jgi:hypothetical protein
MAKRFRDSGIWLNAWFMELEPCYKCLWSYINDNCDTAGVWRENWKLASVQIGADLTADDMAVFGDRVVKCGPDKWFIVGHVKFQAGKLNPNSNPHKAIIRSLSENNLLDRVTDLLPPDFDPQHLDPKTGEIVDNYTKKSKKQGVTKGLPNPLQVPHHGGDQDKDKDKDKDKDIKGGEGGKTDILKTAKKEMHHRDRSATWREDQRRNITRLFGQLVNNEQLDLLIAEFCIEMAAKADFNSTTVKQIKTGFTGWCKYNAVNILNRPSPLKAMGGSANKIHRPPSMDELKAIKTQ